MGSTVQAFPFPFPFQGLTIWWQRVWAEQTVGEDMGRRASERQFLRGIWSPGEVLFRRDINISQSWSVCPSGNLVSGSLLSAAVTEQVRQLMPSSSQASLVGKYSAGCRTRLALYSGCSTTTFKLTSKEAPCLRRSLRKPELPSNKGCKEVEIVWELTMRVSPRNGVQRGKQGDTKDLGQYAQMESCRRSRSVWWLGSQRVPEIAGSRESTTEELERPLCCHGNITSHEMMHWSGQILCA